MGAGVWDWTDDIGEQGFTVTYSLGSTPEEVLQHCGADMSRAEYLTRAQAWACYPEDGGTQLRAGTLAGWGFCFHEGDTQGADLAALATLSQDTETISFVTSSSRSALIYLKDGEGVEAFEVGMPASLRGEPPHKFWTSTQKILEGAGPSRQAMPMPPSHAVLQAIAKHVRGLLDRVALEGMLLTAPVPATLGARISRMPSGRITGSGRYVDVSGITRIA
jgi:hypothetical protein